MTLRRRFCPKGHDTFEVGRDSSYRCRKCKFDDKTASRNRATDARRLEAETIAAERAAAAAAEQAAAQEEAERRREEAERREQAERQRILDAGGEDALELLQIEAWEEDLCGWYEDGDTTVCIRPSSRTSYPWCTAHKRQLEREAERRRREKERASTVICPTQRLEGVSNMFGLRKKGGPSRPFSHAADCRLVKINPDIEIEWQEIETGHWVAECQCGKEYHHEAPADGRVRLDPLDPETFRHQPACDQRDVTDPAILRATLRVHEREGYWWVECSMCACCWQTPYVAAGKAS